MSPTDVCVASTATLDNWVRGVEERTAHIGIVGLGYVGLPLSLLFSEERFRVTGFDVDDSKVEKLNFGESYMYRIGREEIGAARDHGFRATSNFVEIGELDAVLICVPTPLHDDHSPDMSYVVSTIEAIAPYLRPGQLVVLESTTYPGTTTEIIVETINRLSGAEVLVDQGDGAAHPSAELDGIMVAFSPEREDPGNVVTPRREIPKVVGGVDGRASAAAAALYGAVFEKTVAMSSPAAAEMTKLLENIYRCVNIALVNEMKQLCLEMGIDIWEVIAAASTKPFGFQAFYPGPGVGGHCIPVDPFYLTWKAQQFGFKTRFIELAGEVNEEMPRFVVETTRRALDRQGTDLAGARILILGVAYKRDVDDLRESPALRIIDLLRDRGAEVLYNDPFLPVVGSGRKYDLQMHSVPLDYLDQYDAVVILTDHSVYDFADIVDRSRLVVDSRNATRLLNSEKIVRC